MVIRARFREYFLGGLLHGRDRLDAFPDFTGTELLYPVAPGAAMFRGLDDDVRPDFLDHVVYERHPVALLGTPLTVWAASPSFSRGIPITAHTHNLASVILAPHRRESP